MCEPRFPRPLLTKTPGRPGGFALQRVQQLRPHANLAQSYGPELTKALTESKQGTWHVLRTREGWRAMRLNAAAPPKPAMFEVLRGVVLHDWTDATAAEQRTAAVRALAKKYQVKHEVAADHDE